MNGLPDRVGRREYLKSTAAAATVAAGVTGTAAAADYETIVASGQTIYVGDGETWENKLIDLGDRNTITISATGTDWTIRNVGFTGTLGSEGTAPDSGAVFGVADTGGNTSTLEYIYWEEGDLYRDPDHRPLQVWVDRDHSGRLEVNNVYFGHAGCNGIYGSAPGENGNGGDVVIDGCYAVDNHHTAYRISDNDDVIRNSVAYVSGDRTCNRNTWIRESSAGGTATLENLDLITNGESTSVAENGDPAIQMTDVCTDDGRGTGCTPDHYVPQGCPTSAEDAASGRDGGSPSCSIATPGDGATVAGTTTVQVDAGDPDGADGALDVEVAVDGGAWLDATYDSASGYYEYDWDTTAEEEGSHAVDARATDGDGNTTVASGIGVTVDNVDADVFEDFERSSPLDEYGGATNLFGTTSSTVYEGSQALVNDGGDYGSVVSTSGLEEYPQRGDEVHVHFSNASDDNFVAVHLFAQSESDAPDGYTVGIGNSGGWRLWRTENGDITEIAVDSLPASEQISGWYRAEVSTDASTVYADLYDDATGELLASVQADDSTFSSGGIGFRSRGNGEAWDYVVEEADGGSETLVHEDFERTDPLADYDGETHLFDVTSSPVYEGSQALVNGGGTYGSVVSTSGLGDYPSRGDEVTYYFSNASDDNFVAFHLFAQSEVDAPDGYTVGIGNSGGWRLWRTENGDITEIAIDSLPASEQISGWYRAEITSDATTVYADLYDDADDTLLASVQADDTTYSSGGIGFRSWGNGEAWDYVHR